MTRAAVAPMVERAPVKGRVVGSTPTGGVAVPFYLEGEAQSRGRVWTSAPFVLATAHGPNAALRTAFAVEILQIPNWVWTDRTGNLRASVQQVTWNTLSMGSDLAFYAPFIEAWGSPVRQAYQAALDTYGYGNASLVNPRKRRKAA